MFMPGTTPGSHAFLWHDQSGGRASLEGFGQGCGWFCVAYDGGPGVAAVRPE